jgi:hypothetical protein
MSDNNLDYAIMLRFRDLVTESGANIAEHRKLIRQRGYAWWGWWARSEEHVPRTAFRQLLPQKTGKLEGILFDRGLMRCYRTTIAEMAVAPSHAGINSPDFEATPEYYVRGRYPAWFRLVGDIVPVPDFVPMVVARPTLVGSEASLVPGMPLETVELTKLREEPPTLWIIASSEQPHDD